MRHGYNYMFSHSPLRAYSRRNTVREQDKTIVRELAAQCYELSQTDVVAQRKQRALNVNNLQEDRPVVWLDELPWHELNESGELQNHCENNFAREMETHFRRILYQWKYFQADMVVRDAYYLYKAYDCTETGLHTSETTLSADRQNHIVSHQYHDVLDTMEKVHQIQSPVITARPDTDRENLALAQDILGNSMPVRLQGHSIYHAPWDEICTLRGPENVLIGLLEEPDLLHATIAKFTQNALSFYTQMEQQGLLGVDIESIHCTPSYIQGCPAPDYDGGSIRLKDIWFRGMAQIFSSVSPAVHKEFELDYARQLMDQCAYTYYGCCEPLDNVLPMLKSIPNMRKIGVSPWANVQACAEQIRGDYVYSRKPNPAFVAGNFSAEAVREETEATIAACRRYGCPTEIILKDISTVSYNPHSLTQWASTVQAVLDQYY